MRRWLLMVGLALLLVAVIACGGKKSSTSTPAFTSTPMPTTAAAGAAGGFTVPDFQVISELSTLSAKLDYLEPGTLELGDLASVDTFGDIKLLEVDLSLSYAPDTAP